MKRLGLFRLLSGLGIATVMILTALVSAWMGGTLAGSLGSWQHTLESARPYLRGWRALLYGTLCVLWWDLLQRYRHRSQDQHHLKRLGVLGLVLVICVELTRL
ncbi:hypothetical protein [Pseudomonas sp. 25 R 14]|uniref:hypothetical protein n=1 Tax=Pseudomonas sp. 25 R 14 TaxID=1844109 RepID=UPI00081BE770